MKFVAVILLLSCAVYLTLAQEIDDGNMLQEASDGQVNGLNAEGGASGLGDMNQQLDSTASRQRIQNKKLRKMGMNNPVNAAAQNGININDVSSSGLDAGVSAEPTKPKKSSRKGKGKKCQNGRKKSKKLQQTKPPVQDQ